MSVRRAPSANHGFLSGAYLGNRMTYLDDIWYVGGSRSEVAHAEFWAWQMPIKYLICIIYAKIAMATIFGQKKPWCKLRMMMTLMEVKGHQRSNGVNYVLWPPYLVKRSPDASWEWWWPWWRSEVKWGKLCAMATIFGQKKRWCRLRMMLTLMKVKGHQRSNGVNYVPWLPYLVKRSADASWEWWPWWRSKVIRGQMG